MRLLLIWLFLFIGLTLTGSAQAEDNNKQATGFSFETLMMPGAVHSAHSEWEQQCTACHEQLSTTTQDQLCLDCHDEIALDINDLLGFHGRIENLPDRQCRDCHSEHLGRGAVIVHLDTDNFDHRQTDFTLSGKHQTATCSGCHKPDEPFRAAPQACFDCHQPDDRHKGAMGESCSDCHNEQSWSDISFDHDADTDFSLLGAHQEVTCASCHPDESYAETPTTCLSCHAFDDVHEQLNGPECSNCHSEIKWAKVTFDHDKDTEFSLHGQHTDLTCTSCHSEPVYEHSPGEQCVDCHKADDIHFGSNGASCENCHSEERWADAAFDHNIDTDFALNGAHQELMCVNCHRLGLDIEHQNLTGQCIDCHRDDDAHDGELGEQCSDCHNESSWYDDIRFNHALTSFPLVGMHEVTNCANCHVSLNFQVEDTSCHDCHAKDDIHEQSLGEQCANCHNPNDWLLWQFDHNTQTDYPLDGAHDGLACDGCHTAPVSKHVELDANCNSCHARDDAHEGRFGQKCERCHITESFTEIKVQ